MSQVNPPAQGKETAQLLKRAAKGDESCLPQVRALLVEESRGVNIVELFGSPRVVARIGPDEAGGGQGAFLVQEASTKKLAQVREELAGPDPTPIERLLAERAAVCWFLVNRYESYYANAKDVSLHQAAYHQERIDRAHRRFLSALRTLATVRKLAVPAIQVDIGRSQLNVAGGRE